AAQARRGMPGAAATDGAPADGPEDALDVEPDAAGSPPAVGTTVALAVLVGLSAYAGSTPTALAVAFAAVVMVWGWAELTDAPSPRSATAVVGFGALAICLAVVLTRSEPYLVWAPAAVAVSVVAAFLHQVLRRGGRPRLTAGVASSVAALAITACGVPLIPLPLGSPGPGWVAVAMAAVALTAVLTLGARRPRLRPWVLLASAVLGTAVAVLAAVVLKGIPLLGAAVLGLLVSAVVHVLSRVLLALPGARTAQAAISVGAATVLVAGVLTYLVARVASG
ncbi:MAG: hypothetical protein M3171_14815, partial [Actinomycetota bacterium]|nr:hypothetical protein [Actinomycetota bacterium]